MTVYHTQDYTDEAGNWFRAEHYYDDTMPPPWTQDAYKIGGESLVTGWERRGKRPGELILANDGRGNRRYFDYQMAMRLMREELPGVDAEARRDAVMQCYERLRAWCTDAWWYAGITAFPLTPDRPTTMTTTSAA